MKKEIANELWEVDSQLFATMRHKYQSENEKVFFEQMLEKELCDCAVMGDLILSENDNEAHLYIYRIGFEEFEVGVVPRVVNKLHTMNLSEALSLNLKDCGFLADSVTLLQWLRLRDYKGVRYDQTREG